jgi:DNA-binding MarR family transcriptional regulator
VPARQDEQLDAWSALVGVYHSVLHDVVRALEGESGLDSGVFSALAYLSRADPAGRLRLSDLHDLMHPRYSQPGLSRLVQRMEADRLVARKPDPADGRATLIVMTRAGKDRFVRAESVYDAALREHFGRHLSPAQARALIATLEPVARGRAIGGAASRTVRPR